MKYKLITAENFHPKRWSGGTSTELFIFPQSADYQLRNFAFRLSTATVETEKSDFTSLPGISRKIMILDGTVILDHEGHYSKQLSKFDTDEFSGDWKTSSTGKCTDFNLMTTGKTSGKISAMVIKENQKVNYPLTDNCDWLFIYAYSGKITLDLDKKKITINKGDLLAISELSIISIDIQAFENSELILTQVT